MAVAIGRDLKVELESFSVWDSVKGFRIESVNANVSFEENMEIDLTLRGIENGVRVNVQFGIGSPASIYLKEKLGDDIISGILVDLNKVIPTDVVKYLTENAFQLGCKYDIVIESPTYTFENLSSLVERERIEFPTPTLFGETIKWPESLSAVKNIPKANFLKKKKKELIMEAIPQKQLGKRRIRIE